MIVRQPDGIYRSSLFASLPGLIHGFTTRVFGDMRRKHTRDRFLKRLSLSPSSFFMTEQVHGATVAVVKGHSSHSVISDADALVAAASDVDGPIVLGVRVADCAPIFFVDPVKKIIGLAHAGWRGTIGNITHHVLEKMRRRGSDINTILIAIGPCIKADCYAVSAERAEAFTRVFGDDKHIVQRHDAGYTVDIAQANRRLLMEAGILDERIDVTAICTACDIKTWYSYRKETKETFGEMLGYIGFA